MTHVLLLAATPPELAPTVRWLRERAASTQRNELSFARCKVEVLFTGIGLTATAYLLGNRFAQPPRPTLAIQAGIAGSYDRSIPLGTTVNVVSEALPDLGAEASDGCLLSLSDLGFSLDHPYDSEDGVLRPPGPRTLLPFPAVAGSSVQLTTGTEATRQQRLRRYPDLITESMEGAAFFHGCLCAGVDGLQLRAISNYVGTRDRSNWKINEAISSVNTALQQVLTPFIS